MTRLKVCGLREVDHALAAADAGADFLGFNFVPGVRRRLEVDDAKAIVRKYRALRGDGGPRLVGLFANQPIEDVNRITAVVGIDLAQLCGDEPPEYWEQVDADVIRQIKVREGQPAEAASAAVLGQVREATSRGHLAMLDSHEGGALGGTGRTFDWSIARDVSRHADFFLAGGLSPENVEQAIATASPWGVDVSSGVETDGVKDPHKIAAFAEAVRSADRAKA